MYCEEIDWCRRMSRAGWQVFCAPNAEVMHRSAQTTRKFREEMFVALWESRFRLYEKHRGRRYANAVRQWVRWLTTWDAYRIQQRTKRGELSAEEGAALLSAYGRVRAL
jgi:GT2 family glycosyltransferase